jgi:hypothetical protein
MNPDTKAQSNATFEVEIETDVPGKGKTFVPDPDRPSGSLATVEIPVVSVTDLLNDPPLLTLLLLNILHYNKTSDFDDWCQKACYPFQVIKFGSENERDAFVKKHKDKTQAPGLAMMLWGEHSDAKFVEVVGTGMEIVKLPLPGHRAANGEDRYRNVSADDRCSEIGNRGDGHGRPA